MNIGMRAMSTDLNRDELRPYFLWDEDMSIAEFRERLHSAPRNERLRLLARLLREARDSDVWRFVSPSLINLTNDAPAGTLLSRCGRR